MPAGFGTYTEDRFGGRPVRGDQSHQQNLDRLLDPNIVSDEEFLEIVGSDRGQLLRRQISAQDIFDRRVLPGLREELDRDLRDLRARGAQAMAVSRQRSGDMARRGGFSDTRFERALDAGAQSGLRRSLAQAQANRRLQFDRDVRGEKGNRFVNEAQRAMARGEARLQNVANIGTKVVGGLLGGAGAAGGGFNPFGALSEGAQAGLSEKFRQDNERFGEQWSADNIDRPDATFGRGQNALALSNQEEYDAEQSMLRRLQRAAWRA